MKVNWQYEVGFGTFLVVVLFLPVAVTWEANENNVCAGKLRGVSQGGLHLRLTSSPSSKCRCQLIPRSHPSGLNVDISAVIMPANKSTKKVCLNVFPEPAPNELPPMSYIFCTLAIRQQPLIGHYEKGVSVYFTNREKHRMFYWFVTTIQVSVTRGTLDVDCWEGHGKKPLTPTSTTTTPTTTTPTWIDCGVDTYFVFVMGLAAGFGGTVVVVICVVVVVILIAIKRSHKRSQASSEVSDHNTNSDQNEQHQTDSTNDDYENAYANIDDNYAVRCDNDIHMTSTEAGGAPVYLEILPEV